MALQVVDGLKAGLTDPASGGIKSVLSQQQLVELARIFLSQAARTPGMVAGGSTELQASRAAWPRPWPRQESPPRPGRLARHRGRGRRGGRRQSAAPVQDQHRHPRGSDRSDLIKDLLSVAGGELTKGGRKGGGVLFGATLREAITVALQSAAGNAKAAVDNQAALKGLAETLSDLVRTHPDQYGSKEWLSLYQTHSEAQASAAGDATTRA